MRAKPARESGSSRVLGISRLASAVVRKKKQNRTELKKTVRFSLNARLSTSETMLSQDAKPDSQQLKPEQDVVETCKIYKVKILRFIKKICIKMDFLKNVQIFGSLVPA